MIKEIVKGWQLFLINVLLDILSTNTSRVLYTSSCLRKVATEDTHFVTRNHVHECLVIYKYKHHFKKVFLLIKALIIFGIFSQPPLTIWGM